MSTQNHMKIIFMGSAAFAVPSLIKIYESEHDLQLVITQPDKPAGRGKKLTSPPVADRTKNLDLPLYQPKSIKSAKVLDKIRDLKPDLIAVVAYGKLLSDELLKIPPLGCINIHSSLLPKYRGAAPINWAIVNGDKESGVTSMYINSELDAGDILLQEKITITDNDDSITLHNKLAPLGADILMKTIRGLEAGSIERKMQNPNKASFAPIIQKEDGHIKWHKSAIEIQNLIRGMQPWPSAYTFLNGKMLRIYKSSVLSDETTDKAGEIHLAEDAIIAATGKGKLAIQEVQIEGKKRMCVRDFLNGYKINSNTILE